MKGLLTIVLSALVFINIHAQVVANDSAETGIDSKQTTFYSLATGQRTVTGNDNWHLAISVRATQFPLSPIGGTTIRINEAFGTKAYYVPNANAANFAGLDTTGYRNWMVLHDVDTALDEGALNSNRDRTNVYDFGWGTYNASTHDVVGDSLYLIQLPNGELKKFWVVNLDRDTAFNITYANLDNSDLQTIHISKKQYLGKAFVYMNLADNTITDKEPFIPDWDLQFLKYSATDVIAGKIVSTVGVWLNKGASAAKRTNQDVLDNNYSGLNFSNNLNAIGWNWKYTGNFFSLLSGKNYFDYLEFYQIQDSLTYFVRIKSGEVYKLVFTKYNATTGRIHFYKEKMEIATGIEEKTLAQSSISLFPNPATSVLNIVLPSSSALLRVMDISGRLITETTATENIVQLNTSDFASGVYLLQTTIGNKSVVHKFVVNK